MIAPVIGAGVGLLGSLLGDLFGSSDSSGDIAKANAASEREKRFMDQAIQDYQQEQIDKSLLAGTEQNLVKKQIGLPPTLMGGDVTPGDFTPRITY